MRERRRATRGLGRHRPGAAVGVEGDGVEGPHGRGCLVGRRAHPEAVHRLDLVEVGRVDADRGVGVARGGRGHGPEVARLLAGGGALPDGVAAHRRAARRAPAEIEGSGDARGFQACRRTGGERPGAEPGGEVVAGQGRVAVAAGGDVPGPDVGGAGVEVLRVHLLSCHRRLGRHHRRRGARPSDRHPRPVAVAVVDRHARVRVGVEGQVGGRPHGAAARHTPGLLVGAGGLVEAAAASSAAPGRLLGEGPAREAEACPPDRDHTRRGRRPAHNPSVVAGGGEVADAGLVEVRVRGRLVGELARAPAVGDVAGVLGRVLLGRAQARDVVVVRLDEKDARRRREGVRPLDVETDLEAPTGVANRKEASTRLVHLGEIETGRRGGPTGALQGKAVLGAEGVQVAGRVRVVVGVDDGDRLTRAGGQGGREAVDGLDHARRQPGRRDGVGCSTARLKDIGETLGDAWAGLAAHRPGRTGEGQPGIPGQVRARSNRAGVRRGAAGPGCGRRGQHDDDNHRRHADRHRHRPPRRIPTSTHTSHMVIDRQLGGRS